MEPTKKWYQSKALWGVIISLIGFLVQKFVGAEVTLPENPDFEQLQQYSEAIANANGSLSVIVSNLMMIVGLVMAWFGRVSAKKTIH